MEAREFEELLKGDLVKTEPDTVFVIAKILVEILRKLEAK